METGRTGSIWQRENPLGKGDYRLYFTEYQGTDVRPPFIAYTADVVTEAGKNVVLPELERYSDFAHTIEAELAARHVKDAVSRAFDLFTNQEYTRESSTSSLFSPRYSEKRLTGMVTGVIGDLQNSLPQGSLDSIKDVFKAAGLHRNRYLRTALEGEYLSAGNSLGSGLLKLAGRALRSVESRMQESKADSYRFISEQLDTNRYSHSEHARMRTLLTSQLGEIAADAVRRGDEQTAATVFTTVLNHARANGVHEEDLDPLFADKTFRYKQTRAILDGSVITTDVEQTTALPSAWTVNPDDGWEPSGISVSSVSVRFTLRANPKNINREALRAKASTLLRVDRKILQEVYVN